MRSRNHCCSGKATMHSLCIAEVHVTVNCIKILSVAQQCFCGEFMSPATTKRKYVGELIAVKVLHTSFLNTIVVAFKVLPLGSYAPMIVPSPPFKTILELVLWNGLQSCRCITPDVINVIKMPSFQYFLQFLEQKKVTGG